MFSRVHSMYDVGDCSLNEGNKELLDLESSAFRLLTAQAWATYLGANQNYKWCFKDYKNDTDYPGRTYYFNDFVANALHLTKVFKLAQMAPKTCEWRLHDLEELLTPLLYVGDDYRKDYDWWSKEFLPKAAEAFSCGFTDNDNTIIGKEHILPPDIKGKFVEDLTIRQSWRFLKGYLRGPQKQREPSTDQQDFKLYLYVPFLDLPIAKEYLLNDGPGRTGYNTYQGPATWGLWHAIAGRITNIEDNCFDKKYPVNIFNQVKAIFVSMIAYYAPVGPCPYCREHFMSRVSRNDMVCLFLHVYRERTDKHT